MSLRAKWQDWFGKTTEELFVQFDGPRIRAQSIIKGTNPDFTVQYKMTLTDQWVFRELELQSSLGKQIFLGSDGNGKWVDYKNHRIEGLDGAIDIDFVLTPFTNTLPLKRLQLERGESRDVTVAWIDFPSLEIKPETQRYTCLAPGSVYRFESLDGEFMRDIEFGEDGLVQNYPEMFKRLV
jgi:hypothetical protein